MRWRSVPLRGRLSRPKLAAAASLIALTAALFGGFSSPAYADAGIATTVLQLNPASDPPGGTCALGYASGTGFNGAPTKMHNTVDLTQFANQAIRLRFSFDTVDSLYNAFEGWYLNNISVTDPNSPGSIFSFNGSDDTSGWTVDGNSGQAPGWQITTTRRLDAFGGPSWWYGNDSTGTYQHQPLGPCTDSSPNHGTLTSPVIGLGGKSTLGFDTLWQIESVNPSSFDLMRVQVVPVGYLPTRDGYRFNNQGPLTLPTYDQMASYYPSSRDKIYQSSGGRSNVGKLFYDKVFVPTFNDGLCYGMATSDTFLFNRATPPPGTNARWGQLPDPFAGDILIPPITTGDQTIEQFVDRYHARQLASAAAQSSINVWNSVGNNIGTSNNRTQGNLSAFDQIAAHVRTRPQVVALGPSPFFLSGGPQVFVDPISGHAIFIPPADWVRFYTLFNNSHAVVAYDTLRKSDGTRVIKVYDPSSANLDDARIEVAGDGSIKLISLADGPDANGNPKVWIGGGFDSQHRDMGQPGDWVLMPLQDADFSDTGNIPGSDNRHWVIPDNVATAINLLNAPRFLLNGSPLMHFSGPGSGGSAVTLPAGTTYDNMITAMGSPALTAVTISGHLVTATQTDANAAGSSHHMVVDPAATSIQLDSATQAETFNLELGGDYLPAFSRKITLTGLTLAPSESLNVASDLQTSGLTFSASHSTAAVVSSTIEQTGANPGQATVQVTVPASSIPATVSIFDWNNLGSSLIYEVIDAQGTPSGEILQGNAGQVQTQIAIDLASLQNTIATITDQGLRNSLQVKVAHAQDKFAAGQTKPAANILGAMRNEVDAQAGKKLSDATAATLRQLSADALILLAAN